MVFYPFRRLLAQIYHPRGSLGFKQESSIRHNLDLCRNKPVPIVSLVFKNLA